ncbi:hypothetical protein Tco_0729694 [Tanacetum coccineum]|uniref:Ubiquitin-like protease family profile domain-containing protein n=1 Tax=Tanacetum coccineum TaxID=301880 RepID=A0ABQ4YPP4_9ASTR
MRILVTEEAPTGPSAQPEDDTSANIVLDTPSPTDAETGAETDKMNSEGDNEILIIGEEQGEDVANKVNLEENTAKIDKGQAGSDPGKTPEKSAESQPPPEHKVMKEDQAGSNPGLNETFDQFFNDKPSEDPGKANMETEVKSMVTVPIHQASSIAPPLVFTLELRDLPHKIDETVNEAVKEAVQITIQAPLKESFRDLSEADMKEILHDRMFKNGTYQSLTERVALYEALEASMEHDNRDEFLAKKDKSSTWKTSNTRESPSSSSKQKSIPHSEQPVKEVPIPDDVNISDSEDIDTAHLPKIKTRPDWLKPIPEEDRPETPKPDWVIPPNDLLEAENNWANALAKSYKDSEENKLLSKTGDMGSFIKWYCKRIRKKKLTKADLEGPAYMTVKPFHTNNISFQFQMEECHRLLSEKIDLMNPEGHRVVPDVRKPLPLGGPPGQVTIQPHFFFFNRYMEYLVSGDNERRYALSISKLKAAYYLDFRLEELVLSLWIESEHDYDISAAYGITHWWFKQKEFYIKRQSAPSDRRAVRSHMWILSKLNHLPGSDKVHLFNAVNKWIKNIVIKQRVVDLHLGIESYQTKLNLTQPSWDASDFLFKEDYTIISKPRAIIYRDRSDQKKMMRLNKVYKFSDGTLTRVLERLDHMVKDFRLFKYNPSMESIIWFGDDKRRSKEFMEVIERRLKIRRIFKSLKSFVSGRLRDVDYRLIQRTE